MKRRVLIAITTLAIALLGIALACGSNPIVVATIDDTPIKCQMPDAGDAGDAGGTCPTGYFCSACGSQVGLCEKIEADQCATTGPQCGCDGISYLNACLREGALVSFGARGPCDPRTVDPIPCTPTGECRVKGAICGAILPFEAPVDFLDADFDLLDGAFGIPEGGASAAASMACQAIQESHFLRFCWVVPDECPSLAPRTVVGCDLKRCIDECSAIKDGGIYFLCPPDASAD